jgi:Flp pilus assembly protein TadG
MRSTAVSGRRGAVIVETTLVAPLLVLILLGILEMALLMKDHAALSNLVRAGGRGAETSVATRSAPSQSVARHCTATGCSTEHAPAVADVVAAAIEHSDAALSKDAIDELWIYKANPAGYPGAAHNTSFDSCLNACVVYRWNSDRQAFDFVSGNWDQGDVPSCTDGQDAVGVYLKATHSLSAGLFSQGVPISDHAVFTVDQLGAGCP